MRTKIGVGLIVGGATVAAAGYGALRLAGYLPTHPNAMLANLSGLDAAMREVRAERAKLALCPEFTSHSQCEADIDCRGC